MNIVFRRTRINRIHTNKQVFVKIRDIRVRFGLLPLLFEHESNEFTRINNYIIREDSGYSCSFWPTAAFIQTRINRIHTNKLVFVKIRDIRVRFDLLPLLFEHESNEFTRIKISWRFGRFVFVIPFGSFGIRTRGWESGAGGGSRPCRVWRGGGWWHQ